LVRGTDFVFEALGLAAAVRRARAVVTGEGRLDEQSLDGKLIGELARRCAAGGVDLHVVTGRDALGPERTRAAGIATVREARTELELLDAGREIARELLTCTAG
jgi:glycerate kinase